MNVTSDKSGNSSSNDSNGLSNDAQNGNSDNNDDGGLNNEMNSSKKKKKNTCLCCLKEAEGSLGCSRCGTAHYCGKACQVKHWPVHKNSCRDSNGTEDSNEKLIMIAENHSNQGNCIYILRNKSLLI